MENTRKMSPLSRSLMPSKDLVDDMTKTRWRFKKNHHQYSYEVYKSSNSHLSQARKSESIFVYLRHESPVPIYSCLTQAWRSCPYLFLLNSGMKVPTKTQVEEYKSTSSSLPQAWKFSPPYPQYNMQFIYLSFLYSCSANSQASSAVVLVIGYTYQSQLLLLWFCQYSSIWISFIVVLPIGYTHVSKPLFQLFYQ